MLPVHKLYFTIHNRKPVTMKGFHQTTSPWSDHTTKSRPGGNVCERSMWLRPSAHSTSPPPRSSTHHWKSDEFSFLKSPRYKGSLMFTMNGVTSTHRSSWRILRPPISSWRSIYGQEARVWMLACPNGDIQAGGRDGSNGSLFCSWLHSIFQVSWSEPNSFRGQLEQSVPKIPNLSNVYKQPIATNQHVSTDWVFSATGDLSTLSETSQQRKSYRK